MSSRTRPRRPSSFGRPTSPIGWGWFYLSTVLDDFSRYIIAWKLCPTMKVEDVTATLNVALKASGLDQAKVIHRPRLLSDNGSSYIAADLTKWLDGQNMEHVRGAPYHPMTQGKIERWHQTLKNRILARELLPAGRSRNPDRGLRRRLQSPAISREHRQPDARRRLTFLTRISDHRRSSDDNERTQIAVPHLRDAAKTVLPTR